MFFHKNIKLLHFFPIKRLYWKELLTSLSQQQQQQQNSNVKILQKKIFEEIVLNSLSISNIDWRQFDEYKIEFINNYGNRYNQLIIHTTIKFLRGYHHSSTNHQSDNRIIEENIFQFFKYYLRDNKENDVIDIVQIAGIISWKLVMIQELFLLNGMKIDQTFQMELNEINDAIVRNFGEKNKFIDEPTTILLNSQIQSLLTYFLSYNYCVKEWEISRRFFENLLPNLIKNSSTSFLIWLKSEFLFSHPNRWETLKYYLNNSQTIPDSFNNIFSIIIQSLQSTDDLYQLINYLIDSPNPFNLNINSKDLLINKFNSFNLRHKLVTVLDDGKLKGINDKISNLNELSKNDYDELVKLLQKRVLIDTDIYQRTSPGELKDFQKFLEDNSSNYDCVVDGLNLAYTRKSKNSHQKNLSQNVIDGLFYLKYEKNRRICLIGRKHMQCWNRRQLKKINELVTCQYYVDDESSDDGFIIWASLYPKMNETIIISADNLRDALFRIGSKERSKQSNINLSQLSVSDDKCNRSLFQSWLQTHQFIPVNYYGRIFFKKPKLFQNRFQLTNEKRNIMIPYEILSQVKSVNVKTVKWIHLTSSTKRTNVNII
ncbi:hypothetical protein SNEBB_008840 [Seison nebaliae]|nr:hypothetical protein SNEBB_008840 [Seison nebaliae]